jgi:hypothetical protein
MVVSVERGRANLLVVMVVVWRLRGSARVGHVQSRGLHVELACSGKYMLPPTISCLSISHSKVTTTSGFSLVLTVMSPVYWFHTDDPKVANPTWRAEPIKFPSKHYEIPNYRRYRANSALRDSLLTGSYISRYFCHGPLPARLYNACASGKNKVLSLQISPPNGT